MNTNMKHPVYDTDTHFTIDPVSREMSNTACLKSCLIQHDHNSERYTFEVPQVIEGHDMSKCDLVQVHYINIDSQTKEQSVGVYDVTDMTTTEDERIYFSWLISHNATEYVGGLSFLIRFSCFDDKGNLSYVWNTAIYSSISISNGIDNGEFIADDYADILNQWKAEIDAFRLVTLEQTQESTESEGLNVWTATFADGSQRQLAVRNGKQGEHGTGADPETLAQFVKKTDYAKIDGEHGIVKLPTSLDYGLRVLSTGELVGYRAGEGAIRAKASAYAPITPSTLDYAMVQGIAYNGKTLTNEEKASALAWLGAVGLSQYNVMDGSILISNNGTTTHGALQHEDGAQMHEYIHTGNAESLLDIPQQTELVSYKGTGESGSANPCSLTFSFAPDILVMLGGFYNGQNATSRGDFTYDIIPCKELTTGWVAGRGFVNKTSSNMTISTFAKKSEDGKTISWYEGLNGHEAQCNHPYYEYYVLAIRYGGNNENN